MISPGVQKAALHGAVLEELLLNRVQLRAFLHALDRRDAATVPFDGQRTARQHRLALFAVHRAHPATAGRAAALGADQVEIVTQYFQQGLDTAQRRFRVRRR